MPSVLLFQTREDHSANDQLRGSKMKGASSMAKTAGELIAEAKVLAKTVSAEVSGGLDGLRREAKALFDKIPEPPSYKRQNSPLPKAAEDLIQPSVQFLAKLYALSPDNLSSRSDAVESAFHFRGLSEEKKNILQRTMNRLVLAMEAQIRALSAIACEDVIEGDIASDYARLMARKSLDEGARFRFTGNETPRPVFDPDTGVSRYDPDEDSRLTIQVQCPRCAKLEQHDMSPFVAGHMIHCSQCGIDFHVVIGYVASLHFTDFGVKIHYTLGIDLLGEARRIMEFDDRNRGQIAEISPNDLVAFVYSNTKVLAALANLTTGRIFPVKR